LAAIAIDLEEEEEATAATAATAVDAWWGWIDDEGRTTIGKEA